MSRHGAATLLAVGSALAILFWPFATYLSNPSIIYNALAADTFYYAAIARNFTQYGFFGIDGDTISNGFMPLWQLIVTALDMTIAGPGTPPATLLQAIFVTSLGLIAVGVAGLVLYVANTFGARFAFLSLLLLCPGAAFFAFEHAYHQYQPNGIHYGHSIWSFANGMELGLGLALFALLLPVAGLALNPLSATHRNALIGGALVFLIFMARLDDVFLGIAFGICLLPVAWRLGDPRLIVQMALVPLVGTAIYLGLNAHFADSALPTSGILKTAVFGLPNRWQEVSAIGSEQVIDIRILPVVASILIGAIGLLSQIRLRSPEAGTPIVTLLSLYLLLKAGFLFSSVPHFAQGYWYYTNMIAAMNMLTIIALSRLMPPVLTWRSVAIALPVIALIAVAAAQNTRGQLSRFPLDSYTTVSKNLCTNPQPLLDALGPEPVRIIDTGDGVYAFCLGLPAVTLTGLADSQSFVRLRNEKGLFPAALERGHNILVQSPVLWASYGWRTLLGDYKATMIAESGLTQIWRITPP